MSITNETLNILIFLIPGFLSSIIYNTVVTRSEKEAITKIIEALTFSFINYSIVSLIFDQSPVVLGISQEGNVTKHFIEYKSSVLVPIAIFAIIIPLSLGLLTTTDILMKILRRFRITNKTARESIWLDIFTDQKRYVIVHLKDGRRIYGWPMYFSNTSNESRIYLSDPAWIDEDKADYIDLNIHGLFIVEPNFIDYIEFLNNEEDLKNNNLKNQKRTV